MTSTPMLSFGYIRLIIVALSKWNVSIISKLVSVLFQSSHKKAFCTRCCQISWRPLKTSLYCLHWELSLRQWRVCGRKQINCEWKQVGFSNQINSKKHFSKERVIVKLHWKFEVNHLKLKFLGVTIKCSKKIPFFVCETCQFSFCFWIII